MPGGPPPVSSDGRASGPEPPSPFRSHASRKSSVISTSDFPWRSAATASAARAASCSRGSLRGAGVRAGPGGGNLYVSGASRPVSALSGSRTITSAPRPHRSRNSRWYVARWWRRGAYRPSRSRTSAASAASAATCEWRVVPRRSSRASAWNGLCVCPGATALWCSASLDGRNAGARSERFQRCLSRVRTALVMTVMRLGLMRDLRKICHDFSRAMRRSTGALAAARDRLTVRWVRVSSPPGGRLCPVVTQGPAPW